MNLVINPYTIGNKYAGLMNNTYANFIGNVGLATLPKDTFEKNQVCFTGVKDSDVKRNFLEENFSPLEVQRLNYLPKLPPAFSEGIDKLDFITGDKTEAAADKEQISELFPKTYGQPAIKFKKAYERNPAKPLKVGVILSGGQASGGHNVISGLYDAIKEANPQSELYGFFDGPKGLIKGNYKKLTDEVIDQYRNLGGFDMICSGRGKIEKPEEFESVLKNCKKLGLNAITVIGGDDSNTNAAVLAEWFMARGEDIQVIGCPKTIDGDLKNEYIETPFGFDSATKVYSEIVGNIAIDTASAKKHWHFIKVMGRSASHVALEVGLKTHPNATIISEEIAKKGYSLDDVANQLAELVAKRSDSGKDYGVVVIPEGLLDFIPEIKPMIDTLNDIVPEAQAIAEALDTTSKKGILNKESTLENNINHVKKALENSAKASKMFDSLPIELKEEIIKLFVKKQRKIFPIDLSVEMITEQKLDGKNKKVFESMPDSIKTQLLKPRDSHGNLNVSQIDTHKLLAEKVAAKLELMEKKGLYSGKFQVITDFQGYGGRAGLPSNFDCDYGYSLGYSAAALINSGKTGYLATINNLYEDAANWSPGGTPITMMMNMEKRDGEMKPVIQKALVDLNGPVFKKFKENRLDWAYNDKYLSPGPIQFDGKTKDFRSKTLRLETEN